MPNIYDNIESQLASGLRDALESAKRADFCVGYFNLRGWSQVAESIDNLSGEGDDYCRLLVGMMHSPEDSVARIYTDSNEPITQGKVLPIKEKALEGFAQQLMRGYPKNTDESTLRHLAQQLEQKRLRVKLYTRHPLHAKLYLAHHKRKVTPLIGFVGSSNLTFAGLVNNGELNVDVVEQDAAQKLSKWFEERWEDDWSLDITDKLLEIIRASWAGGAVPPYHIYIKTAWHLSHEAMQEAQQFKLPVEFAKVMLPHQKDAVSLAAQRLHRQNGVIIGDVVGLGKTMVASAVAKIFHQDLGIKALIICPPALQNIWEEHIYDYDLNAKALSLGQVKELEEMRHYPLVIIDESHNLRNRKSARHKMIREYIREHASKVMMLTATPYNMEYEDIGSQLLLFNENGQDLGIVPENYIASLGGRVEFNVRHADILPSSLAAFEKSDHVDDWRELMRLFMVRRTRKHIQENYALYDEQRERYYLTFANGKHYYFPERKVERLRFEMKEADPDDQYAQLYSGEVVQKIGDLELPRYGLAQYLCDKADMPPIDAADEDAIGNLNRSGKRLRGFARTNLFKRLESSGNAFLISIERHILKNMMMLAAYHGGALPIGEVSRQTIEDEEESDEWMTGADSSPIEGLDGWERRGAALYKRIHESEDMRKKFKWMRSGYFSPELIAALRRDAAALLEVLRIVPQWSAAKDRKLQALRRLCQKEHPNDKILLFSQYKDTVEYIGKQLADIPPIKTLHGDHDGKTTQKTIKAFSPLSNGEKIAVGEQIRILIATDKLSEGVNLQDAHIIINYDLPWAIIRLIQRAGRVDRIGQKNDTILCYSAMPEKGIEKIINLRRRLIHRINQNNELLGFDQKFIDENEARRQLESIYSGEADISGDKEEDDTDLTSFAHNIWAQAIKKDPSLEKLIPGMPDVVYSSKRAEGNSVIAYIQNSRANHILAEVNGSGEILSQSQFRLLEKMKCDADEPAVEKAENHHKLVSEVVRQLGSDTALGGQLGSKKSTRRRIYDKLEKFIHTPSLFVAESDKKDMKQAHQQIHRYPLKSAANEKLTRQMGMGISDADLAGMVLAIYRADELCERPAGSGDEKPAAKIICSMGLINE